MNKWTKDHTIGLAIGLISPLVFIPIILFLLGWLQNYPFSRLWHEFDVITKYQIKILTFSLLSNLIWFYIFLNRERFNLGRGIIIGTLVYAPYIVYIKFF